MRKLSVGLLALGMLLGGCDHDQDGDEDHDSGAAVADAGRHDAGHVVVVDAGPMPVTYVLALTAGVEVPVCTEAADTATGAATVMVDAANTMVTLTGFTLGGLSSRVTAAHIHSGAVGVAGPIIFPLEFDPPVDQTFTAADYPSPAPDGAPADFAAFVQMLRAGDAYINVHTQKCMGGEIRAQIE